MAPDEKKVVRLVSEYHSWKDIFNNVYDSSISTRPNENSSSQSDLPCIKKSLSMGTVVAVGPSTKNALERNGINVHVTPQVSRLESIVKALYEYVSKNSPGTHRTSKRKQSKTRFQNPSIIDESSFRQ